MSHWTEVKTEIRDMGALVTACQEMGLCLAVAPVNGKKLSARGYYGGTDADAVVRLKGPYDLALNRQPDGRYSVKTDFYQGHVEREVGKGCGRLLQGYAYQVVAAQARRKGLSVHREKRQDGTLRVTVGGW